MSAADLLNLWISAMQEGKELYLLMLVIGVSFAVIRETACLIRFGVR